MEEEDVYTKDGTVDYRGKPANRKKTGTWKACPFILGNECCERLAYYGMSSNLGPSTSSHIHIHTTEVLLATGVVHFIGSNIEF
ncbi:hypothetical protein Ddye_023458 [Dipteronia dyeriana]|uniref:Uncharacterized protein n=1 Tax=Dipteronia dyeriana TaxID=168575 RepID=A0AAD9TTZ4_9ROSI|nr:hypothetical protein Ddye_023458 [Dipteronia dyeriana]